MDFYKGSIPIIDDGSEHADTLFPRDQSFGYVPRDYRVDPESMMAGPESIETIDPSEWDARFDEQEATQSSLEHIFLRGGQPAFTNLDQDGQPDCWCFSTGHAAMLLYLKAGLTPPRLNPHFLATHLKTLDGGWCGKSMKEICQVGCCLEGDGPNQWPAHSHDGRLINQARLDAAGRYRIIENVYDLTREVWDQRLTAKHLATCGFMNNPAPSDFNWWGHSVCQVRWVRVERGSWGPLILNSWKGWGRFGLAVLRGSQATAGGAVAALTTTLAA